MVASSRWMSQLDCHPSIIIWVVFNEAWGQFNTEEVRNADIFCVRLLKRALQFWSLSAFCSGNSFQKVLCFNFNHYREGMYLSILPYHKSIFEHRIVLFKSCSGHQRSDEKGPKQACHLCQWLERL